MLLAHGISAISDSLTADLLPPHGSVNPPQPVGSIGHCNVNIGTCLTTAVKPALHFQEFIMWAEDDQEPKTE